MTYRIYYGDGSTHDNGQPEKPPARDVQVIIQRDPERGPYFQSGADYYVWRGDHWRGVDIFGLYDFLLDSGLVLFGRTITNAEYAEIYQQAKGDKSSFLPGERKP
jgi:hypothetical protein